MAGPDLQIPFDTQIPHIDSPTDVQTKMVGLRSAAMRLQSEQNQQQIQAQTMQENALKLAAQHRNAAGTAALSTILQDKSNYDPETGEPDQPGISRKLMQAGFPEVADDWTKIYTANADALEKYRNTVRAHLDTAMETVGGLAASSSTSGEFKAAVGLAAQHGLIPKQQALDTLAQIDAAGNSAPLPSQRVAPTAGALTSGVPLSAPGGGVEPMTPEQQQSQTESEVWKQLRAKTMAMAPSQRAAAMKAAAMLQEPQKLEPGQVFGVPGQPPAMTGGLKVAPTPSPEELKVQQERNRIAGIRAGAAVTAASNSRADREQKRQDDEDIKGWSADRATAAKLHADKMKLYAESLKGAYNGIDMDTGKPVGEPPAAPPEMTQSLDEWKATHPRKGAGTPATPAAPAAAKPAAAGAAKPPAGVVPGAIVKLKSGQRVKVKTINPNGTFDYDPVP